MSFKDHFSNHSALYAKFRPYYPDALYEYLAGLTRIHDLAWDCGTGNGQAAIGLKPFFKKIVATDPSAEQLKHSVKDAKIDYRLEKAEETSLAASSVDMVTVANALHWFHFDSFYAEVNRVLKPGGVIVAWCYYTPAVNPGIDVHLKDFHDNILSRYWLPENNLVVKGYSTIPFPFQLIECPDFYCKKTLSLDDFINYLRTWSAVQRFISQRGVDPTDNLRGLLAPGWKNEQEVTWTIKLKAGKKIK